MRFKNGVKSPLRIIAAVGVLGVIVLGPSAVNAQTPPAATTPTLQVSVWAVPPFVAKNPAGKFSGFSIDLMNNIANEAGFDIAYFEVGSIAEQLDSVRNGTADISISEITITSEREKTLDFSTSMFESGIEVMVTASSGSTSQSVGSLLSNFFSPVLLRIFAFMVLGTLLTGVLVWFFEHRHGNEGFQRKGAHGIFDGIWWATVTLFTIGYGDKVPHRVLSRVVTIAWMFTGVLLVASLTAEVTTSNTISRLESGVRSVSDLQGKHVVAFPQTTSWDFLNENGMAPSPINSVDAAYEQVRSGEADAFVGDAPLIRWLITNRGGVQTAGPMLKPENFGIAFPEDSPNIEAVNQALLRLREDGTYERLKKSYFG